MTTCYDYFKDCDDKNYYETQRYKGMMDEYAAYAEKKLGQYCEFVAYAYLDGIKSAKETFDKLGLRLIHAYAIQSDFNDFVFEYDEKERNEPDYE